jgi:hypothetical protein
MERAETQWIADWLEKHPDRDEDSARSAWESLYIEVKMYLMAVSDKEIRITEEIHAKLLVTLEEYPAPEYIKEPFRKALM